MEDMYTNAHYYEQPKKKKERKLLKLIMNAICFGLIAGIIMFGIVYFGEKYIPNGSKNSNYNTALRPGNPDTIQLGSDINKTVDMQVMVTDVSSIVKSCMPSVVAIDGTTTKVTSSGFYQQQVNVPVCGSGIILGKNDTELLIVTNAHVVEDVDNLKATFIDGSKISAVVKGTASSKDLAVIAVDLKDIKQETMDSIVIAEIGDASDIVVGQSAIAIGNAMGYGQSVTVGVISALNREVKVENATYNLIQTDAAINPGNSGGALINAYGQVIGINSVKLSNESVEGMGYAIPISDVMDIIEELMSKETRKEVEESNRGYLGISGNDINATTSSAYGYPQGIYIAMVQEDSAAEKAGLVYRDIIVGFDGEEVKTMSELKKKLAYYSAGEVVEVEYYRYVGKEYKLYKTNVTLQKSNQ